MKRHVRNNDDPAAFGETMGVQSVSLQQVQTYRLNRHNLARRLPVGELHHAAGACGLQNSPPGAAELALHARLTGLTPELFTQAVTADKTLLQAWSVRAAPLFFPTIDAAVFLTGVLPDDEQDLRHFLPGVVPAIERVGISALDALELTSAAVDQVLDGQELTRDELGVRLAERVAQRLSEHSRTAWHAPSWYAKGQQLGESIMRFFVYVVALQGKVCYAPRHRNTATFLRTDQWLGQALPPVNRNEASSELVRRYLRCYGPSTPRHFAEWAGISPAQATHCWQLIQAELVAVNCQGSSAWIRTADLGDLLTAEPVAGVRLLPPHDPFLALRDRQSLVPDPQLRKYLWRTIGNPGVLLVGGQVAGAWRTQKRGKSLTVIVEQLTELPSGIRTQVELEATSLAAFVGCGQVSTVFSWLPGA